MRRIVIAPKEAHQNLYNFYRKDNPFCDVKFYTLESFLNEANYQSDDSSLLYLIKNHSLDYYEAQEHLRFIKRIKISSSNSQKINKLIALQKELIANNLLFKNEYFDYEISNAEIDIYFYSDLNQELLNVIKDKKYTFHKLEKATYPKVYNFFNNNDELSFLFNKISELISNGVKANDICLFGLTESDELTFRRLKDSYGLNFNNAYRKNYLAKNYINKFVNDCLDHSADEVLANLGEINDETYEEFLTLVNRFKIEGISLDKQSGIYKALFKSKYLKEDYYVDAINVVDKPIAKEGGYLFIINFVQGKYPIISRDNDYLSNEEKAEIGLNTSDIKNAINIAEFSEYLRQNMDIFVSFSNRNYTDKYSKSPLIKILNLSVIDKVKLTNYYSLKEAKLAYANLKDLRRNYLDPNVLLESFDNLGIFLPYRLYNYRYKKVNHFFPEKVLKLSYTQVKTYYQCKFKYYLDNVLNLDESETNFNMSVGTLAHAIFERIGENKTFDELYEEELAKITSFDKYDWVYLRRIKEEIRKTYEYIIRFEKQIDSPKIYREIGSKDLIKLDEHTNLVGKIDKLITFNGNNFVIIDYKMGHEEFSENLVEYGLSLQLPTYALIAKNKDDLKSLQLAGLFIQRFIVSKSIASKVDTSNEDKPLLSGVYLADENVIGKLDSSLSNAPSNYIYSCKLKKDGGFSSERAKSEQYFDDISLKAKDLILKASHSIIDNDFEIDPKIISGDNKSCKYCPYRDICYRDERAYKIYTNGTGEEDGTD